jgi:hypothetical protein
MRKEFNPAQGPHAQLMTAAPQADSTPEAKQLRGVCA